LPSLTRGMSPEWFWVDAACEGQRVGVGGKKTIRLGDGAKGTAIPPPHEDMKESDSWWSEETQGMLHTMVMRLGK
jgi:hypothetical protein